MRFRIPPALSSVLTVHGTLQLRAVGILNRVHPLVSPSNLYILSSEIYILELLDLFTVYNYLLSSEIYILELLALLLDKRKRNASDYLFYSAKVRR